jgi:hypothetical protein
MTVLGSRLDADGHPAALDGTAAAWPAVVTIAFPPDFRTFPRRPARRDGNGRVALIVHFGVIDTSEVSRSRWGGFQHKGDLQ